MITGGTLQEWGFKPGKWFKDGIAEANRLRGEGADDNAIFVRLQEMMPVETLLRTNGLPYATFLDTETPEERANAEAVARHMDALMRVPTIRRIGCRWCKGRNRKSPGRRSAGAKSWEDPSGEDGQSMRAVSVSVNREEAP